MAVRDLLRIVFLIFGAEVNTYIIYSGRNKFYPVD